MLRGTLLHVDPLEPVFRDGVTRYMHLRDREVLSRVYVVVRNRNWGAVPGRTEQHDLRIRAQASDDPA